MGNERFPIYRLMNGDLMRQTAVGGRWEIISDVEKGVLLDFLSGLTSEKIYSARVPDKIPPHSAN